MNRSLSTKFIEIHTRHCIACWKCVVACHRHTLGKVDFFGHRHARIEDASRCTGCRLCVSACGSGAIVEINKEKPMDTVVEKRQFNKRAFVSVALCISGLILPFSGIMNHELQFAGLTVARHFWMSVHNMSAMLFVGFLIAHLSFNWKALVHYVRSMKGIVISRETIAAVATVAIVVGLFASHALQVRP